MILLPWHNFETDRNLLTSVATIHSPVVLECAPLQPRMQGLFFWGCEPLESML